MRNRKKLFIFLLYFTAVFVVFFLNSTFIVEWLNKSLFVDYEMDIDLERVSDSFFNGTSAVFLITIILYAFIGTFIVSLLVTNLLFSGLIYANQTKVLERNEFITFKELQTITSPKELLSFIEVPASTALFLLFSTILLLITLHYTAKYISSKMNFHVNIPTRVIICLIALIPFVLIFQKPNFYNEVILKYEEEDSHNFNPVKRARSKGFLPSFFHTVSPDYMPKPYNYKKSNIIQISEKYKQVSEEINKFRTKSLNDSQTIYYLSETLMDPISIPDLLTNETPIPFISETANNHIGWVTLNWTDKIRGSKISL